VVIRIRSEVMGGSGVHPISLPPVQKIKVGINSWICVERDLKGHDVPIVDDISTHSTILEATRIDERNVQYSVVSIHTPRGEECLIVRE
jgi:hypothetical protein